MQMLIMHRVSCKWSLMNKIKVQEAVLFFIAYIFKNFSLLKYRCSLDTCFYFSCRWHRVKNLPANAGDTRDTGFDYWVGKIPWSRKQQLTSVFRLEYSIDREKSLAGPWGHRVRHDWALRRWDMQFEQAPGIGDGQRSLACCSPWGHKESDTTERLNWKHYML